MKRSIQLKLAEVEASYRTARPDDLSSDDAPAGDGHVYGLRPDGRVIGLDETLWRQEGEANGWEPPGRRPWWRRLWVVRHVGALVLSWKVHTYAGCWAEVGIGIGGPHPQDLWVVEGAYHGYW